MNRKGEGGEGLGRGRRGAYEREGRCESRHCEFVKKAVF